MVFPHGEGDLYHKYRPQKFSQIVGHKEQIKSIKKAITSDHPSQSFMLVGSSGTGKTTTARIIALSLNCEKPIGDDPCLDCKCCKSILSGSCPDVIEINAADARGIEAARDLRTSMSYQPMTVSNKVYILDEAQGLTPDAQSTLLKVLEEAPKNVFIIICTTNPEKIKPTVRNRCQKFKFGPLPRKEINFLLESVAAYEGFEAGQRTYDLIIDNCEGLPRNALVLLQQVSQIGFSNAKEIDKFLLGEDSEKGVFDFCVALLERQNVKWSEIKKIYSDISHLGAEAIWMTIAGYSRNALIKTTRKKPANTKHVKALELFSEPIPSIKPENKLVYNIHRVWKESDFGLNRNR